MRDWLCLALLAAAAALAVRWYPRRVDELGRRVAFPWVGVLLLVALAVATAVPGVLRGLEERRLSGVASALAGARVTVRCQGFGGAFVDAGAELGYVPYHPDGRPERWTLIKRDPCRDLARYLRSGGRRPSRA